VRLATLGVAVVLLVGMTPALAHTASTARDDGDEFHTEGDDNPNHEITSDIPYRDEIVVEDDAYVDQGYWGEDDFLREETGNDDVPTVPAGLALNGTDTEREERITWLSITPGTSVGDLPYEVTVTVEGPVVAAMDVFRVQEDGTGMTPNCPQHLVEDLYPEQGEGLGYAFRILQKASQNQRAAGAGGSTQMSIDLAPDDSYIVAVYPQAATGLTDEQAKITTEVEIAEGEGEQFILRDNEQIQQQPDQPFHLDEWIGGPSDVLYCAGEGIGLPLGIGQSPEMPGSGPFEQRVTRLLGTSIMEGQG
jgi:hypothetical protein